MLGDTIKELRKSKGLTQEELALKLNVVRQTVSKWEQGLSVPDASMLIVLAEKLDTPVSVLLGEPVAARDLDELAVLAEKLEIINLQLARQQERQRKVLFWVLVALCGVIVVIYMSLLALGSSYLSWDFSDPETAVAATLLHGFEWIFVRGAPILLIATIAGAAAIYARKAS